MLILLACASPDDTGATADLTSAAGLYEVTLSTEPSPPLAGEVTLLVGAPGASSLAVEGAMAGMDHGFGADPVVTGGEGAFEALVVFSMSGTWELTFTLDGEPGPDTLVTDMEVR